MEMERATNKCSGLWGLCLLTPEETTGRLKQGRRIISSISTITYKLQGTSYKFHYSVFYHIIVYFVFYSSVYKGAFCHRLITGKLTNIGVYFLNKNRCKPEVSLVNDVNILCDGMLHNAYCLIKIISSLHIERFVIISN